MHLCDRLTHDFKVKMQRFVKKGNVGLVNWLASLEFIIAIEKKNVGNICKSYKLTKYFMYIFVAIDKFLI